MPKWQVIVSFMLLLGTIVLFSYCSVWNILVIWY